VLSGAKIVVRTSPNTAIKFWDVETGTIVRTLEGHTGGINAVAALPDGRYLISAREDKTFKLWDVETGRVIRTFVGHTEELWAVAIVPRKRLAISASNDATLRIWDIDTGQTIHTLQGHTKAVCDVAVTANGQFAISASEDKTVKVWDIETGQLVQSFEGHAAAVVAVAITPDTRFVVSGSWDSMIKVWDLQAINNPRGRENISLQRRVAADGFLVPTGRFTISSDQDGTVQARDIQTGEVVRSISVGPYEVDKHAIARSGRVAVLAVSDAMIKIWNIEKEQDIRNLENCAKIVHCVAITSDGELAITAVVDLENTLEVWDIETGRLIYRLNYHNDRVNDIALTPNDQFFVSVSEDRTLQIFHVETGTRVGILHAYASLRSCTISPDGKTIRATDELGGVYVLDWIRGDLRLTRLA